jgi:hypothetical protein
MSAWGEISSNQREKEGCIPHEEHERYWANLPAPPRLYTSTVSRRTIISMMILPLGEYLPVPALVALE